MQRISTPAAWCAGPSQEHPSTAAGSSHVQPSVTPCTHAGALTPTGLGPSASACALITRVPQTPKERARLAFIGSVAGAA